MTQAELLQRIKERLLSLYGDRFRGLVLYGSVARGDDDEESDIDLLCLLEGPVDHESSRIHDETYPIQQEYFDHSDRMFHIIPVNAADYNRRIPLYMEARKDGILV